MPTTSSFIAGSIAVLSAFAGLASAGCQHAPINSISYCQEVESITYDNVGFSGTYQDVTEMNSDACTCSWTTKSFSGPLAPLDEELSLHFRGPLRLKQVAVYMPGDSSYKKKRSVEKREHLRRHAHHAHKRDVLTTTTTIYTTITIGEDGATPVPYADDVVPPPTAPTDVNYGIDDINIVDKGKGKKTKTSAGSFSGFTRTGYYNAEEGVLEGLVFMNHKGGQGSGVFDDCFGNSISYANSKMSGGSSKPEILEDVLIPSNNEFIIFSDQKCSGDSCGYYQSGIPAYHGFGGESKIFLFEFSMPADTYGDAFNLNIPAIWALNAKIPRTAQYGKQPGGDGKTICSCWDSGCGELDLFEVLKDADDYVKTHYHSKQGAVGGYGGGGNPDYFARPYDSTIKAAVVFDGNNAVHISIIPSDTEFLSSLPEDIIVEACKAVSVFAVPS